MVKVCVCVTSMYLHHMLHLVDENAGGFINILTYFSAVNN